MARPRSIDDGRLLRATGAVIGRRGPGFTLADVAAEAGVAAGTLIARFGSRAGLLRAVTAAGTASAVAAMRKAAAAHPGRAAAARAALVAAAGDLADPDAAANHLAQLGADLGDPELREGVRRHVAAVEAETRRLVRAAADLPAAPAPAAAARILVALWHGSLLGWSLRPRGGLARRLGGDLNTVLAAWGAR